MPPKPPDLRPETGHLLAEAAQGSKLNFECPAEASAGLLDVLCAGPHSVGAVPAGSALYKRLKVREYLRLFARLWNCGREDMERAVRRMRLEDLLLCPNAKLSYSQSRRVMLAREILHAPDVYFIEEPLRDMGEDGTALVLEWLEEMPGETGVVTTTVSFRDICLLPGQGWRLFPGAPPQALADNPARAAAPDISVDKIPARDGDSVFLFNPGDIDYAESGGGKTMLVVHGSRFACPLTLEDLEEKLVRYGFYRCHRSYLVNMQKVREIVKWTRNSYSLRLEQDGADIPLSKGRIEEIKDIYQF